MPTGNVQILSPHTTSYANFSPLNSILYCRSIIYRWGRSGAYIGSSVCTLLAIVDSSVRACMHKNLQRGLCILSCYHSAFEPLYAVPECLTHKATAGPLVSTLLYVIWERSLLLVYVLSIKRVRLTSLCAKLRLIVFLLYILL